MKNNQNSFTRFFHSKIYALKFGFIYQAILAYLAKFSLLSFELVVTSPFMLRGQLHDPHFLQKVLSFSLESKQSQQK